MDLKITLVQNASTPGDEWVILQATDDTNLYFYAVVDTTFDEDESVSNEHRHVYFFPAQPLAKGDFVALCSGVGNNGIGKLLDGTKSYDYYWQSGTCIWNNNGGDTASLIEYRNGNSVEVPAI